jgi:hypothetical protein
MFKRLRTLLLPVAILAAVFGGVSANAMTLPETRVGGYQLFDAASRLAETPQVPESQQATGFSWYDTASECSVAAKSIPTPQGPAIQSMTAEAQAALRQAQSGAPVYRGGGLGTQRAAEGQYWSFQNPASTPGYANRMGMPGTGAGEPFIMGGRVNPSSPFITREAPGIGNNLGGSVEAVTQPGGVTIDWFHMP